MELSFDDWVYTFTIPLTNANLLLQCLLSLLCFIQYLSQLPACSKHFLGLNEWEKGFGLSSVSVMLSHFWQKLKEGAGLRTSVGSSLPCSVCYSPTGVAYTSECFPCKPGTFSNKPGSFSCQVCPRNTYSEKGAKECTKCAEDSQFSGGSNLCPFILYVLFFLNVHLLSL